MIKSLRWKGSRLLALVGALLLAMSLVAPAAAQEPPPTMEAPPPPPGSTTIASGLDTPRKLVVDPDGNLIVVIVGRGSEDNAPTMTGEIVKVAPDGTMTTLVSELPSGGDPGDTVGVADIARWGPHYYFLPRQAAPPDVVAPRLLQRLNPGGTVTTIADLGAFEAEHDPDGKIDSNPYGLAFAPDGTLYAVDAGGNDMLKVGPGGRLSLVTAFEPFNIEGWPAPVEPVPTGISEGPGGDMYISFLTGFPFPKGEAWVARINQNGQPETFATGLTALVDLAMGPDGNLYGVQVFDDFGFDPQAGPDAMPNPSTGSVVRIDESGNVTTVASGLVAPGGVAFDASGNMYVTTGTAAPPGVGSILRWDNVAPAKDWETAFRVVHGNPPTARDRADREWSLQFAAQNGRAPTADEWREHFSGIR